MVAVAAAAAGSGVGHSGGEAVAAPGQSAAYSVPSAEVVVPVASSDLAEVDSEEEVRPSTIASAAPATFAPWVHFVMILQVAAVASLAAQNVAEFDAEKEARPSTIASAALARSAP
jgi:hypothetical protein